MLAQRKINPPPSISSAFPDNSPVLIFQGGERQYESGMFCPKTQHIDPAWYRTQSSLLGFQRTDIHLLPIIQLSTQKSLFGLHILFHLNSPMFHDQESS